MGVFEDIIAAVESYPEDHVTLEIVDVSYPGSVYQTSEIAFFKVDIRNSGPMHMKNVTVRLVARNGAQVRDNGAFEDDAISDVYPTIAGHRPDLANVLDMPFELLAPSEPNTEARNLVKVTLHDWDLVWDHALIGHSDPTEAIVDKWASSVQPRS